MSNRSKTREREASFREQRYTRRENTREVRSTFLIVCEGTKTEKLYFEAFKITKVKLEVKGQGRSTESLVQKAIAIRNREQKTGVRFNKVWCVFDKDESSDEQFNRAIRQAEDNNIRAAYSNEAFELWYLLHFELSYTASTRRDYIRKLTRFLRNEYDKTAPRMYELLKDKQSQAIKNAKTLIDHHTGEHGLDPARSNPCTNIHELVEALNELAEA